MSRDLTGTKLGPFFVEARLGEGAMGAVYRAQHRKTGKYVAIKVMNLPEDKISPTLVARFEREIELIGQFHHPNIVRSYGASEYKGIRYYAMELVEGWSLDDLLERRGRLSPRRTIGYGVQICEALQEMHAYGVVHRDLKPANLMISKDNRVKLTDFGIAKDLTALADIQLTKTDQTVGTVAYMSPEQLSGKPLNRRSDLYSLGILLYRMLTGKLPFAGETMFDYINQRMKGHFANPSSVDSKIPTQFDDLMRSLLAREPEDRPRDAYVVMQRLLEIRETLKMQGTQTGESSISDAHGTVVETVSETRVGKTRFDGIRRTLSRSLPLQLFKRVTKRRPRSIFDSTAFLVGCLAVVLCVTAYAFWPAGPKELLAKGERMLQEDDMFKWRRAIRDYFVPVASGYPGTPEAVRAEELRRQAQEKLIRTYAEGRSKRRRLEDSTPAEQEYRDAMELAASDALGAYRRFKDIAEKYANAKFSLDPSAELTGPPPDLAWALLAKEKIKAGPPPATPNDSAAELTGASEANGEKAETGATNKESEPASQTKAKTQAEPSSSSGKEP